MTRLGQSAPISAVFMFHGLLLGGWATQVPLLRERLALSPGALGVALFCASAGAVAAMVPAGGLARRFGPRPIIRVASCVAGLAFVLATRAPDPAALCLCLLLFGMGFGMVDVAMNAEAVRVEQRAGRPVLGAVHAMWSIGSAAGSAGGAMLLMFASPARQAVSLATLSTLAILIASARLAGPAPPMPAARPTHRPWRDSRLRLIGGGLCLAFAVEGAVADWGGVYLRAIRHVPASRAALGYSAFSLCMVAMRLAGDRLRGRFGNEAALLGAFAAAGGTALVLAAPDASLAVAGFGMAGLGLAGVVPALFALAGARGGADLNAAVGTAATLGYAGVLGGPPLFGFLAQATSLPVAIGAMGALCCGIGVAGLVLRRP